MFNFAGGGIVGFKEGGDKGKYETPYDRQRRLDEEEGTAGLGNALLYGSAPVAAAADVAALPISLVRNMFYNGKGEAPGWTPVMDARARALAGNKVDALSNQAPTQEETPGPTEQDVIAADPRVAAALAQRQQANSPAGGLGGAKPPAAPGAVRPAAAGLGGSGAAAMLKDTLGKQAAQPTAADAISSVREMQKAFGVDQPAGAEERARIAKMEGLREAQNKDRAMRNLITYLTNVRGSTIGEGLGRGAQMSQAEIERQNAGDLAHQEKMYELVNNLNKANRAEGVGAAKSSAELLAGREKTAGEESRARLQALANMYHTDIASAAQLEAARIMSAARTGNMDERQQLAELKALQGSLQAQLKGMNQFDKVGRAPLESQLREINAAIAKMAGVSTMSAAPGDAGGNAALFNQADAILSGKK